MILQMTKEYYKKYESTPNFDTLEQIVRSEISQEMVAKIVLDTLTQVKDAPFEGSTFVQEKALKFCKQQELQKAMDKAQNQDLKNRNSTSFFFIVRLRNLRLIVQHDPQYAIAPQIRRWHHPSRWEDYTPLNQCGDP